MESAGVQRVVIVGAGPRGTSVLERLVAQFAALPATDHGTPRRLDVHLVDPFPPGPGHVWRTDQSRLFLMNTQAFFPTLIPDAGVTAPPLAGGSFNAWRRQQQAHPDPSLSAADRSELAALAATDFPSRPLYGRYLSCCFAALLAALPAGVTVTCHATTAQRVARDHARGGYAVALLHGPKLAADAVVLALGHVDARLSPAQRELREQAREAGLSYLPPAVPNDVDWGRLPAGETVLVRGMGLNFFDVLGQLTEGRGGRFERLDGVLRYQPSGAEPCIVGASRRGTPYRAKAELESYYPASVRLRFLSPEAIAALHARGTTPGFDHDIWPLLHRDTVWAYYTTLARTQPEAVPADFLPALEALLVDGHDAGPLGWEARLPELVAAAIAPPLRLDLPGLARPLDRYPRRSPAAHRFAANAELDAAVLAYLDADAAGSARGEDDPVKMAIGALNAGRAVIKALVVDDGITAASWLGELRGWFESFVEGLASGPPALRIEQLAALVRAGVVHFAGPDPIFRVERGVFTVGSPWVAQRPWEARYLVEALAPANRVQGSDSVLLNALLDDGLARPRVMLGSSGEPVVTSGMDVSAPPYRPLDGAGTPVPGLFVLGLQLSSVQWGTAIAAQAEASYPSGYRTMVDADAIAAAILAGG